MRKRVCPVCKEVWILWTNQPTIRAAVFMEYLAEFHNHMGVHDAELLTVKVVK